MTRSFLWFFSFISFASALSSEHRLIKMIDSVLSNASFYDKSVPPGHLSNDSVVRCAVFIANVWDLNHQTMMWQADVMIGFQWVDPRLNLTSAYMDKETGFELTDINLIRRFWLPQIYFPNTKKGSFYDVTTRNNLLIVTSEGKLTYAVRIHLHVSCTIKLHKFPFDSQICPLMMSELRSSDSNLRWNNDNAVLVGNEQLNQFVIDDYKAELCKSEQLMDNQSNCLQITFHFRREIGYYLVTTYLPTVMIVVLSWASFWLEPDAVPGRVCLCITTLLTISTKATAVHSVLAEVSYVKAIDLWMGTCIGFIFLTMYEFVWANSLWQKENKAKRNGTQTSSFLTCYNVDHYSRYIFPVLFILFNIAYWGYYLS